METERMALSQRERDRLKVLHEVKQGQLTQVEAARRLSCPTVRYGGCCCAWRSMETGR